MWTWGMVFSNFIYTQCNSENASGGGMLQGALSFCTRCVRGTILVSVCPAYQLSFADNINVLPFTFGLTGVALKGTAKFRPF